jgi:hypothetical protein
VGERDKVMTNTQAAPSDYQDHPNSAPKKNSLSDAPIFFERLLGITATLSLGYFCMATGGVQLSNIVNVIPIVMVLSVVLGGLIASHGPRPIAKMLLICFGGRAANNSDAEALRALCRRGRRLTYVGMIIAALSSTIAMLGNLSDPAQVGAALSEVLGATLFAILIAEIGFGSAEAWVKKSPTK